MTLRLLCDEHVGKRTFFPQLRREFSARHVLDIHALGSGATDQDIWTHAVQTNYNVLTADTHFVDSTADPGNGTHPGILLYDDESVNALVTALLGIDNCMTSSQIASNDLELFIPDGWPQHAP